jgi:hypothetical protein
MRRKKDRAEKNISDRLTPAKVKGDETAKTESRKVKKTKVPARPEQQPADANRAQGIALFKLAGRPTKEEFVLVYGEAGPRMTWEQRAKAGIPAEKFQAALAAKQRGD